MSIVKMKAVTISGKLDDFEYLAEKYVYNRDIHLENAMALMSERKGLRSFKESSEYDSVIKSIESILTLVNAKKHANADANAEKTANAAANAKKTANAAAVTIDDMKRYVASINEKINDEKRRDAELNDRLTENNEALKVLGHMSELDVELEKILSFEFISWKFGHMPLESYKTISDYLGNVETFFVETSRAGLEVWGFYFAPLSEERRIDQIFTSLYFEEVKIPDKYTGVPRKICDEIKAENAELQRSIDKNSADAAKLIEDSKQNLNRLLNLAKKRQSLSEIKKKAIHSDMFFFIVGWMDVKSAKQLDKEISASGDSVICYIEEPDKLNTEPPTKLKNNAVFKPFEMFVKMYGLPSYREIDPTPILAITYILFFGIMFGDVGQSLVLSIAGFIMYKVKKWDLGGIVGFVGLSGMIFGFIYGSVFGNEEIIPMLFNTHHLNPMEEIGVMLGGTIAMGVIIIIFGMVLNMINSVKEGHIGRCLVNHNGLAGIIFYVSLLVMVGNMFLGLGIPNGILGALIAVTLIAMYLEEPLEKLIEGEKNWMPSSAMFFVESFFELFEVLLSFFSNTISFLRIGAFAIVHVGMMQVVAVLSAGGGAGGMIVQIVGNIIVMGLEGLIVGIQVLRLEYYEMFSRYFSGQGKEFVTQKIR